MPACARLEGWPLARSCSWPSFETRASALLRTRLIDCVDMIRTTETQYTTATMSCGRKLSAFRFDG